MADLFRTLVIQAQDAPLARDIAAAFGPGGAGMWTTPLSADGMEPATHYISSGYIPEQFVGLAPCQWWVQDEQGAWAETDSTPGDAATVYAYASQPAFIPNPAWSPDQPDPFDPPQLIPGPPLVNCTLAEVEGIFSRADVSDQEPFVAMGRLGLQIVNPPIEV